MPMLAMIVSSENVIQILARPMNSKLLSGGSSSPNGLCVAMDLDPDRRPASAADVVVEHDARAPHAREDVADDADHQHDREPFDRARAELIEHVRARPGGQVAVDDRSHRA